MPRPLQPWQRQGLNRATAAGNQGQYLAQHPGVQTHMNKVANAQQGAQRPQAIASPGAIQGGLGGGGGGFGFGPPPQGSGATGSAKGGGGGQQGGAQGQAPGQAGQPQPMQGPMGGFSQFGGGNPYGGMSRDQLMANMPAMGQTIGYTSPQQQQWNAALAGQQGGGLGQAGQQANIMSQLTRQSQPGLGQQQANLAQFGGNMPGQNASAMGQGQPNVNPQQMQALLQALSQFGAMGPR